MSTRIKKFLLKDPLRRILALGLTLMLYIHLNTQIERSKDTVSCDVPVTLILRDGLKKLSDEERPHVLVELHAPRNYTIRPGAVEIRVSVGHKNYSKIYDRYQVEISKQNVRISDSKLSFSRFKSGENPVLNLNLMRSMTRDIPVHLRFSGNAPFGTMPKGQCLPKKVRVTGPENMVRELRDLNTLPIPLDGAPGDFEYETGLQLPVGVTAIPSKVSARVKLEKSSVRRIYGVPVRILHAPGGIHAEVATPLKNGAEVTLKGPGEVLSRLTPGKIILFADAAVLSAGVSRRRVKLHCFIEDPGVSVEELSPGEIELKLTK